jgi:hypothetical protein
VYSNIERLRITNGNGIYLSDDLRVTNFTYATGFHNVSNASFVPARCNAEYFTNSLSNDLIIHTVDDTQRILFGFNSNVPSVLTLSKSNLSIEKGTLYASNIAIGTTTSVTDYELHVAGDARIEGDLIINGAVTAINTAVMITDQISVSNIGTGPALIVTQYGSQPVAEFKDDNTTVMKIADGGFITIGSNNPSTKLDVEGSATIRGNIYTSNILTSNIQTSSFTTTTATNATTITSNLYSSNLIINNNVIIDSNGIITNSNFIPPLNTSNIVAGQFTSNFILNDNIISSKLESNLVLKGTTTISSNAYINNGDLKILGVSNFVNVGDQARVYLGSNDYFIGSSKTVGIVMQVPGTTYPFILESASGYIGMGTMDPTENLHVKYNTKVEGSTYVMTKLGVAMSNPNAVVDVYGDIQASSNIKSSVGTLGPCFILIPESAFADLPVGQRLLLDNTLEAGNPADTSKKALFYGTSYLYQDTSGENMLWNYARLLFRGCPLTNTLSTSTFYMQDYVNSRTPQYSNISGSFTLSNAGSNYGYVSYATPWFAMSGSNERHLALLYNANTANATFRVGQVHIQFKT